MAEGRYIDRKKTRKEYNINFDRKQKKKEEQNSRNHGHYDDNF